MKYPSGLALAALAFLSGCNGRDSAATTADGKAAVAASAAAQAHVTSATPTPCETDFSARDASDILTGPATLNRYAMNAALGEKENGCGLGSPDAFIDFSIHAKAPPSGDNRQVYQMLTSLHDPKGAALPGAEILVALTVLVLGVLLALRRNMPAGAAAVLFAIAGVIHGYALGESIYGAERTPLYAYLIGLAVIQSAIALTAAHLTRAAARGSPDLSTVRLVGAGIAGIGIAVLMQQITANA